MPTLVILAAGMGSRYGGLKQIDPVGPNQQILLDYAIYDAINAGFDKVVFVIRKDIDALFRKQIGNHHERRILCVYVHQELDALPPGFLLPGYRIKPWGTAHGVWICESAVNEPFAVINADDFYGKTAYQTIYRFLSNLNRKALEMPAAMVGYDLKHTLSPYGAVSRAICHIDENRHLLSITEQTKIVKADSGIGYQDESGTWHPLSGDETVSMNFWGFTPRIFPYLKERLEAFLAENLQNSEAEFLLPTVIDGLIRQNKAAVTVKLSSDPWIGITYPHDKVRVGEHLAKLTEAGLYPEKLW